MAPRYERLQVEWHLNHCSREMTGEAAGIVATLFALCQLAVPGQDAFTEQYHALREFALRHEECDDILAALD